MAVAVATQNVFAHTDDFVETWAVPAGTEQYSLIRQADSDRFGVTITRAPGGTARDEIDLGPYKVSRPKPVGVGGDAATAIGPVATGVAIDGTWDFPIVFSEAAGTTPAPTTTPQGTVVYAEADGDLTLLATGNTRVGVVNYHASYHKVVGKLPVKIGA